MDVRGRIRKVHYDFYLCFTLPYMFDPWLVVAGKLLLQLCFPRASRAGVGGGASPRIHCVTAQSLCRLF